MTEPAIATEAPTITQVLENNICVGCGACSVATSGRVPVTIRPLGYYQADISGASVADIATASRACPFTNDSINEDEISARLYPELPLDDRVGRHKSMFAGRISDDSQIDLSSSGGLTSWTLRELLRTGHVDGVIQVASTDQPMFGYVVARSESELLAGRKSKYFPATFADTLRSIRGDGMRYAFVGIPCAIRAVRLVTDEDAVLREQLRFLVGIVCGHLKSGAYAESFAWQVGVEPENLGSVDFRIKDPTLTSRQYRFGARAKGAEEWLEAPTLSLVGGSWGHAVFQLNACNYCDDVFAETADVVFGDAWLSKYEIDWRGTNVVVTRDDTIDILLRDGEARGELSWDELDTNLVARTQGGNFRHRRDGLAVRLADDEKAGRWAPKKRVSPGYDHVTSDRVELIRQRRALSEASHPAFAAAKAAGDLNVYLNAIKPLIDAYQQGTRMPFATRVRNRLQREFWRLAKKARNR